MKYVGPGDLITDGDIVGRVIRAHSSVGHGHQQVYIDWSPTLSVTPNPQALPERKT